MIHPLLKIVERYISDHCLLNKAERHIVALSGGADSVALLLALRELGYIVEAAHCNFHLRGEESNRDESFVKDLCQRLGVSLHLAHFDTREYAALHKVSIEMAARDLRYAYFERLRQDIGAATICVAHHREDSVETMLINLVRGTGLHGLTGICPRNGRIARPLLSVGRSEIEDFLKSKSQTFVTDSTNLNDDVMRNKIRLDIMPLLRSINPSADLCMARTAERMAEAAKVFDKAIEESAAAVLASDVIDLKKLKSQPSPEYTLFSILRRYGFSSQTIEQIYGNIDAPSGCVFSSATHDAAFDRGRLLIAKHTLPMKTLCIPEEGTYVIDTKRKIKVEIIDGVSVSRQPLVATVDADKAAFPILIRNVKEGDRFVPYGMRGTKLVSDYLTDCKRSFFEKRDQLAVCSADGEIIWLVGERTSDKYKITAETKRVLRLAVVSG